MDLKIVSERDNPLFNRMEVTAQVKGFTSSPARTDVLAQLATHYKADSSVIHIDQISCHYGGVYAQVTASIYKDAKSLEKFTSPKLRLRGVKKEPKKK